MQRNQMPRVSDEVRKLRKHELDFIAALIKRKYPDSEFLVQLPECLVREMNDGGMGSLEFISTNPQTRELGRVLTEGWFKDRDGIWVSVVLNLDAAGKLYELDVWKTDFSRLIGFPEAGKITDSYPATPT